MNIQSAHKFPWLSKKRSYDCPRFGKVCLCFRTLNHSVLIGECYLLTTAKHAQICEQFCDTPDKDIPLDPCRVQYPCTCRVQEYLYFEQRLWLICSHYLIPEAYVKNTFICCSPWSDVRSLISPPNTSCWSLIILLSRVCRTTLKQLYYLRTTLLNYTKGLPITVSCT